VPPHPTGRVTPQNYDHTKPGFVEGLKRTVDAVHSHGGTIINQIYHMGPNADPLATGGEQWGPSDAPGYFGVGRIHAMTTAEIDLIVERFADCAATMMQSGTDGIELMLSYDTLVDAFFYDDRNLRTDQYGGSIANRLRLALEVTEAVAKAIGPARVGIRLSPFGIANDSGVDEPLPLYTPLVEALAKFGLAYLHLIEPRAAGAGKGLPEREGQPLNTAIFRPLWPGVLMGAGGYDRPRALEAVASGVCDLVAFGRHFISTPDIVARLRLDVALNPYNRATFYGGGAEGYTDLPFMA
jgi:N-ethylmaleimide reductase